MKDSVYSLEHWLSKIAAPYVPPSDPFTTDQEYIIYGAGNRGREALALLQNRGCKVRGFLDRNGALGKQVDGLPCVRLEERETFSNLSNVAVLIAVFNPTLAITPVEDSLRLAGFEKIFSFYDLNAILHKEIGDFFWLTNSQFWYDHADAIQRLAALFHDKESRDALAGILALRLYGDFRLYESQRQPLQEQYFSPSVSDWSRVERLIDCGAFDGDTIENALHHCSLKEVAAFEPDEANFRTLSERFRKGDFGNLRGFLSCCGVWSETTMLRFHAGQEAGSCVNADGESIIACTSLDEALPGFAPDYIKMDIEGAELQALHGAREIIAKHRPRIAVCLYHAPQHLWEIPFLIESLHLGYSFYLRSHQFNGFDSILYAMPSSEQ